MMRLQSVHQPIAIPILFFCLFFFTCASSVGAPAGAQQGNFKAFVEKVEKQTGFTIAYSENDIMVKSGSFPDTEGLNATQALRKVLDENAYKIVVMGKHVIIVKNPVTETKEEEKALTVPVEKDPNWVPSLSAYTSWNMATSRSSSAGTAGSNKKSSGRLVIIREKVMDERTPTARAPRNTADVGAGVMARETESLTPAKPREIPFRLELLESQAYGTSGSSGKKRR